jgi:hypothetical protein
MRKQLIILAGVFLIYALLAGMFFSRILIFNSYSMNVPWMGIVMITYFRIIKLPFVAALVIIWSIVMASAIRLGLMQ